jgi:TonB dependent receptor
MDTPAATLHRHCNKLTDCDRQCGRLRTGDHERGGSTAQSPRSAQRAVASIPPAAGASALLVNQHLLAGSTDVDADQPAVQVTRVAVARHAVGGFVVTSGSFPAETEKFAEGRESKLLWKDFEGFIRGDLSRKGKLYSYADNRVSRPPFTLVNAKAGIRNEQWELNLYGSNIFDEDYHTLYFDNTFVGAPGGFDFARIGDLARYGVEVTYRY